MKIIQGLSSKIVYRFAVSGWIIQIFYALFFMAPSTDDGFYLDQSLATFHHWAPGTWIGHHFYPVFFDMPTYPFFNGLFYKFLYLFGITPGPYTFRLFAVLCLSLLFILSMKFITKITPETKKESYLAKNILLIGLAVSPFILSCWSTRPEVPGLALFVAALLAFVTAQETSKLRYSVLCGLSLGTAAIFHPIIAFIAFMFGLGILVNLSLQKRFRALITVIAFALIPFLLFGLWFWINKDTAIAQLFYRSSSVVTHESTSYLRGIRYVLENMNPFSNEAGIAVGLYYALFYCALIPLTLIFIALLLSQKLAKIGWKGILQNIRLWLPIVLFIANIIILFSIQMYGPYLLNITFTLVLSIACLLSNLDFKKISLPSHIKVIPIGLVVMLVITINMIAQASKFLLIPKKYYQANITSRRVISQLKEGDQLIITGQRLLPAFGKLLAKSASRFPIHCLFCAGAGYLPSTLWKKEASDYVYNDLAKQDPKSLIWGVMKQDILYRNKNQSLCFLLKGFPAPVLLSGGSVIFQDAGNIFYRPKTMRFGKLGESCPKLGSGSTPEAG